MITTVWNNLVSVQAYKKLYHTVKSLVQSMSLQLLSGMILFLFFSTHLLTLSLGIFSIEVLDTVRQYIMTPWHTVIGTILLTSSLLLFFGITLWELYRCGIRRMSVMEIVQTLFVVLMPFVLIDPIVETSFVYHFTESQTSYTILLHRYWIQEPYLGIIHALMMVMVSMYVWGCVKQCLRKRATMALKHGLKPFAIILPTLAVCGFITVGIQTRTLAFQDPTYRQNLLEQAGYTPQESEMLNFIRPLIHIGLLTLLLAGFGITELKTRFTHRKQLPKVCYKDQIFDILPEKTLLEAIRMAKIPHASICGGKGRCSTCRVRISKGLMSLHPPTENECKVLKQIKAPSSVRLACQIHPHTDLKVVPLLPPSISAKDGWLKTSNYLQGEEHDIAVLFADIRDFTKITETQLPYDVVFFLNQYFAEMGKAIETAGGYLDKFIGDGVMAWFGMEEGAEEGSRRAIKAARLMLEHLQKINTTLGSSLPIPLRIGIGIHVGTVIVGELGYGTAKNLTAIGDTVNLASRLETLTKKYQVDVVISDEVAIKCGDSFSACVRAQTPIRGKRESITVLPLLHHELPLNLA